MLRMWWGWGSVEDVCCFTICTIAFLRVSSSKYARVPLINQNPRGASGRSVRVSKAQSAYQNIQIERSITIPSHGNKLSTQILRRTCLVFINTRLLLYSPNAAAAAIRLF